MSDIFYPPRLTHSTTADFILNVAPPSGLNSQLSLVEMNLLFFQFTDFQREVWKHIERPINFLPQSEVTSLNRLTLKNSQKSEILQWNATKKSNWSSGWNQQIFSITARWETFTMDPPVNQLINTNDNDSENPLN